jgi:hypothetical protein
MGQMAKPTLRRFDPEKDVPLLRDWLAAVMKHRSHNSFAKDMTAWMGEQEPPYHALSRSTLGRFMKPVKKGSSVREQLLPGVWFYLGSKLEYIELVPKGADVFIKETTLRGFDSPDQQLADALAQFLPEGPRLKHLYSPEHLKALTWEYVMYQPDAQSETQRVRVSAVKVTSDRFGIYIEEVQDFSPTGTEPKYLEINRGVIVPYGQFLLAFLKVKGGMSFKYMVIESIDDALKDAPIKGFAGTLVTSSPQASCNSVKFMCLWPRRDTRYGILEYSAIPKRAADWLRRSKVQG